MFFPSSKIHSLFFLQAAPPSLSQFPDPYTYGYLVAGLGQLFLKAFTKFKSLETQKKEAEKNALTGSGWMTLTTLKTSVIKKRSVELLVKYKSKECFGIRK